MDENPAAQLARMKWAGMSAKERAEHMLEMRKARQKALTPEERKEIAKKAAEARWGKKRLPSGKDLSIHASPPKAKPAKKAAKKKGNPNA